MPLRKHVCWGQIPDGDFSSHYATEPKVESDKIARGGSESDPESANDSNSFHCNGDDCIMSTDDEANTNLEYPETHASEEPSTSSTNWASTSSDMKLYSLESRSLTKSNSSQTESLSLCEQFYEENLPEFGSHDENCSCSGCGNDEIEQYTDKEFENLLYSNGVDPSNYVLSSGRWSVNQGNVYVFRNYLFIGLNLW